MSKVIPYKLIRFLIACGIGLVVLVVIWLVVMGALAAAKGISYGEMWQLLWQAFCNAINKVIPN